MNLDNFFFKNAVYVCVKLPELNATVFQSEPALVHENSPKPLNFTTSALLFHGESSQLFVDTEQPITYFPATRSASNVGDKKSNGETGNLRIPDTSTGRASGQIPNRFQISCVFQV